MPTVPDPDLVAALQGALRAAPAVRLALLFGSRARGTAHEASDVDLAVLGADDPLALADALSVACGHPVDLVRLERDLSVPLLRRVLRDAVVLHDRGGEAASWAARTEHLLALDGPRHRAASTRYLARLAEGGA